MDMMESKYDATIRAWEQNAPWMRRLLARIGLQGKLLLCFLGLLSIALAGSCWLFISQSSTQINDMMKQQARQTAYALALAGKSAMSNGQVDELRRIGNDLLKAQDILSVAFADARGRILAAASRNPEPEHETALTGWNSTMLMQARWVNSRVFGEHLVVTAPVLSAWSGKSRPVTDPVRRSQYTDDGPIQLIGYVSVALATTSQLTQLRQIQYWVIFIGCLCVLASLPVAYMMVRRIFHPIRQLVAATDAIAGGQLETQVAIHRPDMIGTLARSFNEMVTRVRAQQESLKEANEELEQKVRERTTQLQCANERLGGEVAEKEDFLRAVSHDLNAPLRNIDGMAGMLLKKHRDHLDADIVHRLERIQQNVLAETELISQLLELSRIKTHRQRLERVETEAVIQGLAEMFEDDLARQQIELSVETPLPVLNVERARLRQIFQNLIDNAIKYMGPVEEAKPRRIAVGCRMRAGEAEFYVRDTGMGIDPEDIQKVFYVFRRGRHPGGASIEGKGVGLASVKSIVSTYLGTIWVESRLGQGSTFRFTINGRFVENCPECDPPDTVGIEPAATECGVMEAV